MPVHRILKDVDSSLPQTVADLISKAKTNQPHWMRYLLSSQLDMDRLDYLRRDSLFTGADYGHFDYFRILNTLDLDESRNVGREIVWEAKSALAIEEYIYARYYMYQNVYLHKTTRGFEKMLEVMWKRAKALLQGGTDPDLVPAIKQFWSTENPSIQDYLRLEEFTVLQQIQNWTTYPNDKALADFARRFLNREGFALIDPPKPKQIGFDPDYQEWEQALLRLIAHHQEYQPPSMYLIKDELKAKYNQPYFPEPEKDEQTASNAIRIKGIDGKPVEIASVRDRLKPITTQTANQIRYYIPKELRKEAIKLRNQMDTVS